METFEQAQERIAGLLGEDVDRPIEESRGWRFGTRVRVLDNDHYGMAYSGEEGYLVLEEVGAEKYNNVRVAFQVVVDGTDCPVDVDPSNIETA